MSATLAEFSSAGPVELRLSEILCEGPRTHTHHDRDRRQGGKLLASAIC